MVPWLLRQPCGAVTGGVRLNLRNLHSNLYAYKLLCKSIKSLVKFSNFNKSHKSNGGRSRWTYVGLMLDLILGLFLALFCCIW